MKEGLREEQKRNDQDIDDNCYCQFQFQVLYVFLVYKRTVRKVRKIKIFLVIVDEINHEKLSIKKYKKFKNTYVNCNDESIFLELLFFIQFEMLSFFP